jgi:S-disulfanyl-L-cysteine oxidoreductase SoxD
MSMRNKRGLGALALGVALGCMVAGVAVAQQGGQASPHNFGTPATPAEIADWSIAYPPDGTGLPAGSGTYEKGQALFAANCAVCHGSDLKGKHDPNLPQGGGPALVGGRGTLNTPKPLQTVESYWPYATTLYDYIHRAMPYTAPDSLAPDQVYSLVAFILGKANIIDKSAVMDAKSVPAVKMPNRDGFFLDDRPMPVLPYSAPMLGNSIANH